MSVGRSYTTAELDVNCIKALSPAVQRVRAEGKVIRCGRQMVTAEVRRVGLEGTLYAHAATTCLVFETRPRQIALRNVGHKTSAILASR